MQPHLQIRILDRWHKVWKTCKRLKHKSGRLESYQSQWRDGCGRLLLHTFDAAQEGRCLMMTSTFKIYSEDQPNVMNYSYPFVSIKHACQKDITISYWLRWLHWLITVYIQKYCNSLSKAILLEIHRRLNPDKKWHNIECSLMLLATHIVLSVNTGHQTEYMDKWQMM